MILKLPPFFLTGVWNMELRQTRWQILGSLVIVIAAFDVVLWQNNHPGSAVALIYGVLLLALLPKQWDYASRAIVCGQWVISGLLLLSLLIQPGFLNVLLAGLSLFVYRLMLEGVPGTWVKLARRVLFWGCFGWIVEWFFLLFSPVKSEDGVLKKGLVRALLLWVLPLIFSLVFIAFLCDGNPIFAKYCRQVLSWIRFPDVERIFFWFLLLLMLSPLFSLRFYRILFDKSDAAYVAPTPLELPPGSFFFESMYRGLFLFNALFLINNIIDIAFLWSGRALPEGVSYAEYAHRSAYPLIVTVLLAGALVMVAFGNAKQLKQYKYIKFLIVFWLAQNVFLVFSSMLRLKKYVDAYSLTEWRMAAWIWMLLVALGLGLLIYRICRDWTNRKFLIANALIKAG